VSILLKRIPARTKLPMIFRLALAKRGFVLCSSPRGCADRPHLSAMEETGPWKERRRRAAAFAVNPASTRFVALVMSAARQEQEKRRPSRPPAPSASAREMPASKERLFPRPGRSSGFSNKSSRARRTRVRISRYMGELPAPVSRHRDLDEPDASKFQRLLPASTSRRKPILEFRVPGF
jgi:hypothetical protein